MLASSLVTTVAFFLLTVMACGTLYFGVYAERVRAAERLNQVAGSSAAVEPESSLGNQGLLGWLFDWLPAPKRDTTAGKRAVETLSHAGYTSPAALKMLLLMRLVAIVGCVLGGLAWSSARGFPFPVRLLVSTFGGLAGNAIPGFYLGRRASTRQTTISRELSDVLDLLVVCVEAGLGIFEAVRVVGQEAHRQGRALGSELSVVSREITAGSTLGQALRAMAQRTGVDDVKSLAAILIQSEKLGSQMAPALRATSDQLRAKRRLRAEEAAYKCAVKMLIPLVLFVMPSMMAVILGPAIVQILQGLPS